MSDLYQRCSDLFHENEWLSYDEYNPKVYDNEVVDAKNRIFDFVKQEIRNYVLNDGKVTFCSYERSLHIS